MTSKSKHRSEALILTALGVLLVAITIVSNALLRGVRLDLTENHLYTITEGTKNILRSIDEPINLYLFFSKRATEGVSPLQSHATRVRELLEEFEEQAGGLLKLAVIDPQPFSEDEDRASTFGLQAISLGGIPDPIYFGLAGTNALDDVEIIEFFQPGPQEEQFLEYDLAKLVYNLLHPDKPVVGLMSSLAMTRGVDPHVREQLADAIEVCESLLTVPVVIGRRGIL